MDVAQGLVRLSEDCGKLVVVRVADQKPVHMHLGAMRFELCGDNDGRPSVALCVLQLLVAEPDVGIDVQNSLVAANVVVQVLQQRNETRRRRHVVTGCFVRLYECLQAVADVQQVEGQCGVGEPVRRAFA